MTINDSPHVASAMAFRRALDHRLSMPVVAPRAEERRFRVGHDGQGPGQVRVRDAERQAEDVL